MKLPTFFLARTRVFHGNEIFKTTNVIKLTKIIVESSYIVLQVTSKLKKLKQPIYVPWVVEFWSIFDIQIDITLAISWEKLQNYTF